MNNSFYRKTMENIRGRISIKLLKTEQEEQCLANLYTKIILFLIIIY